MTNTTQIFPPMLYGTAWKKERTAQLVEQAIKQGFRGIDTACQPRHYNEAGVGEALEKLKRQNFPVQHLFIQTKFTPADGQDRSTVPYDPAASLPVQVHQSMAVSLKNLKRDVIDSLLLHSPMSTFDQTIEVWRGMEELKQKGLVRMLGISNCYDLSTLQLLYEQAAIKPSMLQNRFYSQTGYDKTLRKWCLEKNIQYQSFWTLTANGHILDNPVMQSIAANKNVTTPQLFLRFLIKQKIIPLIGTCSEKHMKEDLAVFDFDLSDSEMEQIKPLLW